MLHPTRFERGAFTFAGQSPKDAMTIAFACQMVTASLASECRYRWYLSGTHDALRPDRTYTQWQPQGPLK